MQSRRGDQSRRPLSDFAIERRGSIASTCAMTVCGLSTEDGLAGGARRGGRGPGTTRHACAAPSRLGSIWTRLFRRRLEGTSPGTSTPTPRPTASPSPVLSPAHPNRASRTRSSLGARSYSRGSVAAILVAAAELHSGAKPTAEGRRVGWWGWGGGHRNSFPVSERREPSAGMEPSRRGAAQACRVVPGPPPQPRHPTRRPGARATRS